MNKAWFVFTLALLAPFGLHAQQKQQQLLPMGSLLHCTTEEKISSARVEIGDPILCRITRFTADHPVIPRRVVHEVHGLSDR